MEKRYRLLRGVRAAEVQPAPGGVGRGSSAAAERVSDDLRLESGDFLEQRRRLAALTTSAIGAYAVVGLYQFGVVRRLPEVPGAVFDADRVDASGEAYALGRTPDAALGLVSAAVTLALAGTGDRHRWKDRPWIALLLGSKVLVDAAGAAVLFAEQVTRHRRVCSWCTLAALANAAAVPAAWPEARAAWRVLRSRR
ncbi:vitamin K epoxide reductase family protein [Streptomyces radiopugnans]|uniref:vitamin K epoxide reductase family protein n=1 Tax=Streptomyces radiopugnans TaxID=403935 RepID=UPI003F1BA321